MEGLLARPTSWPLYLWDKGVSITEALEIDIRIIEVADTNNPTNQGKTGQIEVKTPEHDHTRDIKWPHHMTIYMFSQIKQVNPAWAIYNLTWISRESFRVR